MKKNKVTIRVVKSPKNTKWCPYCSSSNIVYVLKTNILVCNYCGKEWEEQL